MDNHPPESKRLTTMVFEKLVEPAYIRRLITFLALMAVAAVLFGIFYGGGRFLVLLKDSEVSRGLITFLVALTTVLLAIILTVYAIVAGKDEAAKERFSLGKEILTILVGILGTVLGFYFGAAERAGTEQLTLASPQFHEQQVLSHVSGGTPPYRYSLTLAGDGTPRDISGLSEDGWIVASISATPARDTPIALNVSDAKGNSASLQATFALPTQSPAAANPTPQTVVTPLETSRPR